MALPCQVRVHRVSRSSGSPRNSCLEQTALFRCHTRRVKKLAVRYHSLFEKFEDPYCYSLNGILLYSILRMWHRSFDILVVVLL